MANPTPQPPPSQPPTSLTERLDYLEQENRLLRRRLLVDDLSDEVRARLYGWLKGVGASALAIAAALGLGSFAALSSIANEQTRRVATEIATEQARQLPLEDLSQQVSDKLVAEFQQNSDFQQQIIQLLLSNPTFLQQVGNNAIQNESLQGQLLTAVETTAKTSLAQAASQAASQAGLGQDPASPASALAKAATQEVDGQRFYVVLQADQSPEALMAIAQQAQSAGFQTQLCAPKPDKQQSALVVSQGEGFLLNLDRAKAVEAKAQQVEASAYAVLQGRAFFDCSG
jgi:predicted lactoylglutathione lyase